MKHLNKLFYICGLIFLSFTPYAAYADNIQLVDHNGVYLIPITLNETTEIDGILDTGASEMYIPFNIIAEMILTGSLDISDILSDGTYTLADGTVKNKERVNIDRIKIGNCIYHNISAIVGPVNSKMLIGQSLLKNINYIINNKQKMLVTVNSDEMPTLN